MAITDTFRKAVAAGDITSLRIMMKDSLLVDPTFAEFEEMDNAARNVGGLFDPHDGRELNGVEASWNDDYMKSSWFRSLETFPVKGWSISKMWLGVCVRLPSGHKLFRQIKAHLRHHRKVIRSKSVKMNAMAESLIVGEPRLQLALRQAA